MHLSPYPSLSSYYPKPSPDKHPQDLSNQNKSISTQIKKGCNIIDIVLCVVHIDLLGSHTAVSPPPLQNTTTITQSLLSEIRAKKLISCARIFPALPQTFGGRPTRHSCAFCAAVSLVCISECSAINRRLCDLFPENKLKEFRIWLAINRKRKSEPGIWECLKKVASAVAWKVPFPERGCGKNQWLKKEGFIERKFCVQCHEKTL